MRKMIRGMAAATALAACGGGGAGNSTMGDGTPRPGDEAARDSGPYGDSGYAGADAGNGIPGGPSDGGAPPDMYDAAFMMGTADRNQLGVNLSGGHCEGAGSKPLTHPPMRPEDIGSIHPMGEAIGAHVTPIDHQYYYQVNPSAPRNTYPVFASAEGRIVGVQHRAQFVGAASPGQPATDEWRLVISYSCTFFSYLDLLTDLSSDIKAQIQTGGNGSADVNIHVDAGQEIGRVGSQSVDFAVWDLTKPLTGFINPVAYDNAEPWKRFTQAPLNYFTPEVKSAIASKYVRTAPPLDGRIDYDVPGKLIGTWFKQGTNGYLGADQYGGMEYWKGHLSIFPDAIDPASIVFSIGDFGGQAMQFAVEGNTPDPANVDTTTGIVKYVLMQREYETPSGTRWDFMAGVPGIHVRSGPVLGVALLQMVGDGQLRVQVFVGSTADQVTGFTDAAMLYDRGDGAHAPQSTAT